MNISQEIINWYKENKRDLPWRRTKDPYKIWISEIILQQTRVEQGLNYYLRFVERFPNVETLAKAEEDDVLKYWQGLGYYSRARNLHFSAKHITKELNGWFPETFAELKKLKGVGDYTAAAIASFAYNEHVSLVDGNVYRVLSRLFAEDTPIDTSGGKKMFFELAKELLVSQEAQIFNQAIMEFGALQCKPVNPACNECPIQSKCLAFAKNKVDSFPVKSKKTKVRKRYFSYLYITSKDGIYLQKRTNNDIWKGLFEFPLIETESKASLKTISQRDEWKSLFPDNEVHITGKPETIKHQLSHQQLLITFHQIKINGGNNSESKLSQFKCIPVSDIALYAVPKVIENYLVDVVGLSC